MKIDIKRNQKEFEPIALTITIETKEELVELAARLAIALAVIIEKNKSYCLDGYCLDVCYSLWKILDQECEKHGLCKEE